MAAACVCALALLSGISGTAAARTYFGATLSGEVYGQTGNAPYNMQAWDLFERHAGRRIAILNQGQSWAAFDRYEVEATISRGAIPLVTMGLGGTSIEQVASGGQDAAIRRWAQEAKAWGHPFLFAPWWEMNGAWYPWGRQPRYVEAWRRFHRIVAEQGATNVTWTWVVNGIWSDPASDPTPYFPGEAYVDWVGMDSYNWGRMPAQPDRWENPDQVITPTLKILRTLAPAKPVAIVESASTEYGGNKSDWIREMLTTYLPHHPEIKAYLWFNWNFKKSEKREDWPIESSAPAQQSFRKAIQSSVFVPRPISLPSLTKVPPPPSGMGDAARAEDLSTAAEMASGPETAVSGDGTTTIVWSARSGSEFRVFARRISATRVRGGTIQLSAGGADALAPQVALASDGTATVVWTRWDGTSFRVQERRISSGGTPAETTLTLSSSGQNAFDPQVDVAPGGEATVVWKRFDGTNYLVQERRIAPKGTSGTAPQTLSATGRDAVEPHLEVAGDGTATVVWARFDGTSTIVQGRRVKPDGTLATTLNLSAAGRNAVQPQVALGPKGEATVVWDRFDGTNWLIQRQRLTAAGALEGGAVNVSEGGKSAEPQIAIGGGGKATVVWDRFDGSNFVVQARQLGPPGTALTAPAQLSVGGRDAADPQLAIGPNRRVTVLWSRFNGSNWIVQRREIAATGTLAGTTESVSAGGRNAGDPAPAWGSDGTLTLAWKRFNGSGDVVETKTVPKPTAG
jgi:hypothetical protein